MNDDIILMLTNQHMIGRGIFAIPHSTFLDMNVCFMTRTETLEHGEVTGFDLDTLLYREAEKRGIKDMEKLTEQALVNTERYLPPVVEQISEGMICITNDQHTFGAAAMMYKGLLQNVSETMGSDMYILPSSIHEVICIKPDMNDPGDLYEYIQYVNKECLEPKDVLSRSLYYYEADRQRLLIAYGDRNQAVS